MPISHPRRSPKSGQVWGSSLDTYVHSEIGNLPVAQVTHT